jgi:hypothetical protein
MEVGRFFKMPTYQLDKTWHHHSKMETYTPEEVCTWIQHYLYLQDWKWRLYTEVCLLMPITSDESKKPSNSESIFYFHRSFETYF